MIGRPRPLPVVALCAVLTVLGVALNEAMASGRHSFSGVAQRAEPEIYKDSPQEPIRVPSATASPSAQPTLPAQAALSTPSVPSAPSVPVSSRPSASASRTPTTTAYQAEAATNTLGGRARLRTVTPDAGAVFTVVGNVGEGGTLTINGVRAAIAGPSTITIYYISAAEDPLRSATISVNGTGRSVNFPATPDWKTVASLTVPVSLIVGANTIQFGNASDVGPDIDWISVSG